MAVGYQYKTVDWLVASVFLDRDFVSELDRDGVEKLAARCPLGNDLSPDQAEVFTATSEIKALRAVVWVWWRVYDFYRRAGRIPEARAPWRP